VAVLLVVVAGCLYLVWRLPRSEEPPGPFPRSSSETPPPRADEEPGTGLQKGHVLVRGLVLGDDTLEPIPGARVTVNKRRGEFETVTDEGGEWRAVVPEALRIRIDVEAEGYLARSQMLMTGLFETEYRASPLFLSPVAARVSGRVVDVRGKPLEGVVVEIEPPDCGAASVLRSDEAGRFGPEPVPEGSVFVRARETEKALLVLREAAVREIEVDLVVGPPRFVEGVVVDDRGEPVPGATVRDRRHGFFPVTTDAEGRFRWRVPAGAGLLEVVKEGYVDDPLSWERLLGRFVLHRITPVAGRIVPDGGGLRVRATHEEGEITSTTAAAAGRFSLEPWLSGRRDLRIFRGGVLVGLAEVAVTLGAPQSGLEIRLPEPGRVEGVVVDAATDEPLSGTRVFADPAAEPVAVTGKEGKFALSRHPDPKSRVGEWIWLKRDGYRPSLDVLHPEEAWTYALLPLGRVRLRIVDTAGRPVRGATVSEHWYTDTAGVALLDLPAMGSVPLKIQTRDERSAEATVAPVHGKTIDLGDLTVRPPPPDLTIRVVDEEGDPLPGARVVGYLRSARYAVADDQGLIHVRRMSHIGAYLYASGRERISVDSLDYPVGGQKVITVVLRPTAPLRGRVLDRRGRPVPGLEIQAGRDGVTDGHGRFEIEGMAAGVPVSVGLGGELFCKNWALGVPGWDDLEIRLPGTGRLWVRVGQVPGPRVSDGAVGVVSVWLLDREDREAGGPIEMSPFIADARKDEHLGYTVPAGRLAVRFRMGDGAWRAYEPVVVPADGEATIGYDFPLPSRRRVRVLGADGRPAQWCDVSDAISTDPTWSTRKDGSLRTWLHGPLPAGTRRLRICAQDQAVLVTDPIELDVEGETVVRLPRTGTVAGVVRRRDGTPAHGARVAVRSVYGPHERWTVADEAGRFSLRAAVGARKLQVLFGPRPAVVRDVTVEAGKTAEVEVVLPF
jgi:protocatechuate 3,4-dioxygenase beta subunit